MLKAFIGYIIAIERHKKAFRKRQELAMKARRL